MKKSRNDIALKHNPQCKSIVGLPLRALLLCLLHLLSTTALATTQDTAANQPARAVEFATDNNPSRFDTATPAGIAITAKPALKFNPEYRAAGVLFARFPAEVPKQGRPHLHRPRLIWGNQRRAISLQRPRRTLPRSLPILRHRPRPCRLPP